MKAKFLLPLPLLITGCQASPPQPIKSPVVTQPVIPPPVSKDVCSGLSHVTYTGTPPDNPSFVTKNGSAQQLNVAVFAIIPPGWTYTLSGRLKQAFHRNVSWKAGDTWPRVLNTLAESNQLSITIMWASQQVTVDIADAQKQTSAACKSVAPTSPVPVAPHNPFRGAAAAPVKPAVKSVAVTSPIVSPAPVVVPAARTWHAQTGQTLRDVLYSWAAVADCRGGHWSVQWVTPVNYRIDAPLTFSGTWKEALNGIFSLYERASTPLYAGTSTPQCIVKVDDKPTR